MSIHGPDAQDEKLHHVYASYVEAVQTLARFQPIPYVKVTADADVLEAASFLDCNRLELSFTGESSVVSFPKGVLLIPSLEMIWIHKNVSVRRLPLSFHVPRPFFDVLECPYWLCDPFRGVNCKCVTVNGRQWVAPFESMYHLLLQALRLPDCRLCAWLTKGLYDPRLLFKLRDFLLYFSNVCLPSLSHCVIHAWRTVSELRVAHADLVVDPGSTSSQSTTCTGIAHAPDSVRAMADEGLVRLAC